MGIASLVILIAVRATQSELVPTVDEAFSLVADAEPAFAGAYVDGDELVVTMTDQGDPGRALGEMRRLFGGRLNRLRPRVAAAQHAWNSLLSYRHVVKDLFAMEEVLKLDIDEKDNRVVVGVSSLRRVPDMEAYLFAMGVPGSAVTFA